MKTIKKSIKTEEYIAIGYRIKTPKKGDQLGLFKIILNANILDLNGILEKKIKLQLNLKKQALLDLIAEIKKTIVKHENSFEDVYVLNDYLKIKYEDGNTNIYVKDDYFRQCAYLLINIAKDEVEDFDEIVSIDDVENKLSHELHGRSNVTSKEVIYGIDPKQEFIAHCSNMQAWVENDYNTQILHRTIAFPLLKKLVQVGDPKAKRAYKEELAHRLEANELNVVIFFLENKYLADFDEEELEIIIDNMKPGIGKVIIQEYAKNRGLKLPYNFDAKKLALEIETDEVFLTSYERNKFTYNDYKKAFTLRFLSKYSRTLHDSLVDFGLIWNQQKVVFRKSSILNAIDYFSNREAVKVEIPRSKGPLKLSVKEENLAIYIYPKLMY